MNKKTIIWAINPYEKNKTVQLHSALFLQRLAKEFGASITPTYVLSPPTLFLPTDYFIPPNLADFVGSSKIKLHNILKKLKLKSLEPITVITDEKSSLRENAQTLISFAKKQNALFIFAPTHARSGLPRFWLGSFVENLLLYSDIPVFTINPKIKLNVSISSVIYPTDLTSASKAAFKTFLPLAKKLRAKVILYHQLRNFSAIEVNPEGLTAGSWEFYKEELENIRVKKMQEIQIWKDLAQGAHVDCDFELIQSRKSVVDSILDTVKKRKIKLIALNTSSGPVESLFAGGIARQLVRYSAAPVWVVHKEEQ